jgi:hypothetical protein
MTRKAAPPPLTKRSDGSDSEMHAVGLTSSTGDRVPRDASSQRKWTRLLLRELYDLGFAEAAETLEREAGVRVRSNAMEKLQGLVFQHRWDDALAFLQSQPQSSQHENEEVEDQVPISDVPQMKSRAAAKEVALLLLKRKYVHLLLQRQLPAALETFQQQIRPHFELVSGSCVGRP